MATERDYYSILQINRGASQDAIERAYERLARLYDPALSRKPRAALRWQELNEAYKVLGDKQRRSEYDRRGVRARRTGERSRSEPSRRWRTMTAFASSPYFVAGATVAGVFAAVVALVLISVLGGGGEEAVLQPSAVPTVTVGSPTATPEGQTPAPTAPASPPDVAGEEITTASGLKYIDIQPGAGATPQTGQTLSMNYTGWVQADGSKFDSSLDRGQPFTFALGTGAVIKGWDEGIATMQVGGKRRLIIPPDLAYGQTGRPPKIPQNSTLIFDVELLGIQ